MCYLGKPRPDHFLVSYVGSDHDWTSLWSQSSYQLNVSSSHEKTPVLSPLQVTALEK